MEVASFPTTSKKAKRLSKTFQPAKEEFSADEILEKCPEEIPAKSISLNPRERVNRRKMLHKYKAKGKKYKWWTEDDRIEAASVYALTGNASRVSEITGIPSVTIRQWKTTEWWPQVIDRIRNEKDDELDVKLTKMLDKSVKEINDRLEKGDYVYNNKTGEVTRKPIGGKELSVMTSIFVDKRELIRKKKDLKTEQTTVNDRLKKLADEFTKFVKMRTIDAEVTRVEGEVIQNGVREETQSTGNSPDQEEVIQVV